jgi:spore maturation protein CgeB
MKIVMFCHSLVSDWNHGNAHFLRGIAGELGVRGLEVAIYEPRDSWSAQNLLKDHGERPLARFRKAYPGLESIQYDAATLDLDEALHRAELVIVHEWNPPELVRRVGEHRARRGGYKLLFHDTHHRMLTDAQTMAALDLSHYDAVLAYGKALCDLYAAGQRTPRAWIWHEAADTRMFYPRTRERCDGDVVWIGNWGDGERTEELHEFLLEPVKALGLKARVYGVCYPEEARHALAAAGVEYGGWLPNFEVPEVFARFKLTLHIPRRPYVKALPGIPTIRVFEALACGIPLICAPWEDAENLFTPGCDYLLARNGTEMKREIRRLMSSASLREKAAESGLNAIRARHTCAHRVDDLFGIFEQLRRETEQGGKCED